MEEKNIEREETQLAVSGFNGLQTQTKSRKQTFTTLDLTDVKKLYNLENSECDNLINDCIGQAIRVKDVHIKLYEKDLDEPVIDKETGEVIKDKETKKVCILIDDNGQTYVTASKIFTIQMMRFINDFGTEVFKEGLEIRIVSKKIKGSNNKSLGFELI